MIAAAAVGLWQPGRTVKPKAAFEPRTDAVTEILSHNSYAEDLPGAYVDCAPAPAPAPRELFFNQELAAELGAAWAGWPLQQRQAVFSGNSLPPGARPIAQAYAGHQFGGFSAQLGDGRALLVGEVVDAAGRRWDLAFKGSGRTPYSRGGDGKAAVGPMLREALIGESLHSLGIPATRALAVVATGDVALRERPLPAAVLTRVAASHLRVGTFEYFAARGDEAMVKRLVSYALARHPSQAPAHGDPALSLLHGVVDRQARLIAQWMAVGFIHGVMNTDNMSISGQSIDFGPCAFMEAHDRQTVYSSIDHHGRYAYANQPAVAQWNLARLAQALLPVMRGDETERLQAATAAVSAFVPAFEQAMACQWARRLGWRLDEGQLEHPTIRQAAHPPTTPTDLAARALESARALAQDWERLLEQGAVDHTQGWRSLMHAAQGQEESVLDLFAQPQEPLAWLQSWRSQSKDLGLQIDPELMGRSSPRVIARNHLVEDALGAASEHGDMQPFHELMTAIRTPWDESDGLERFAQPAPAEVARSHRTFCGT